MFALLRWFEHRMVYQPFARMDATGHELGRPVEAFSLSLNGRVQVVGWFFPSDQAAPGSDQVVLLCHGNAGNISHRLPLCQALLRTGVAVCCFDYRGYGLSTGKPSEQGTYQDAMAVQEWLVRRGFESRRIIAWGESLGGGVAAELAQRGAAGGLVLQSSFTSIPDVGRELFPWLPVRWIASIHYNTAAKLAALRVPVLILHSRTDSIIPYAHGEKLFAAAREPKVFADITGDHNDPWWDQTNSYSQAWEKFLKAVREHR